MEQKRRLVFIIHSPFTDKPGGRETWITNIAAGLERFNYETLVICGDTKNKKRHNLQSSLEFVRVKTPRSVTPNFILWAKASLGLLLVLDMVIFAVRSYYAAKKLLSERVEQTFFIAMNTVTEGAVAYFIQKKLKHPKVVVSVRGKSPLEIAKTVPYLKPLVYFVEKKVLHSVKNIWANGYDTAEYLKELGVRSVVVPNGVDFEAFSKAGLERSDSNKETIIMSIATLRSIKGIPQLVKSIPEMRKLTSKKFKVIFVGAGNPSKYIRYLGRRDCENYAEFKGAVPSIEVIGNTDAVACLSGGAGMSMSALEAMAAGKATVAWDSPIYQQLLKNGKSALLVPGGDVNKLAESLVNLIENPKLRLSLGKEAQKEAKNYDWKKVCEKIKQELVKV